LELWGKDDTFSRWVNAVCAVPLIAFILFDVFLILHGILSIRLTVVSCVLTIPIYRLLKYALTGTDNINRDDF
jgi:hypothetical protein